MYINFNKPFATIMSYNIAKKTQGINDYSQDKLRIILFKMCKGHTLVSGMVLLS